MIHFEHPTLLYLLLLIPAFVALYVYLRLSRRKRAGAFAESRLYALLTPDVSNIKSHTKFAILMAALFLLIIAVANPQMGSKMVKGERAGIDVAIALDISNSMLADNTSPTVRADLRYPLSDVLPSRIMLYSMRRCTGLSPSRASGRALATMTDIE